MECVGWLLAVAVVWLVVREVRARARIASLEAGLESQQKRTAMLAETLEGLKREIRDLRRPPAETPAPPPPVPAPAPPLPAKTVAAPPPVFLAPAHTGLRPAPARPSPESGAPPPVPREPGSSPLSGTGGSAETAQGPVRGQEGPPPPPSFRDGARRALDRIPRPEMDWENLVGVRLFSWMAGIMLAIAAVLFLRYSIQHGWLGAPVRMAIGILTGAGLLVLCEWKAARRYTVTANALDAAGIAILFATIFASHSLWNLLGAAPAFLLMALVAAVAVALAIRRDSPFIAVLGLLGGFATPALLSAGQDRPFGLFGYLLLLNAGLAWVSLHRRWTVLIRLALAFTFLYQWAWVLRYLDPGRIPLALGIFLVYPALYLLAPVLLRQREDEAFRRVAALGSALPLLLAVYLAAAPGFADHYALLFGYLLLLGAGLAAFAAARGPLWLHTAGAAATVSVWALWLASYPPAAWPEVLAFLAAEVLLYLAAPWVSQRLGGSLVPRVETFAAALLLGAFPALIVLEPAAASPGLLFGVLFLLLLAASAFAVIYESGWLHFGAAFFAVAAEAVWSGLHLTPERLLPGLALYAVFGLFYLGVPVAARRLGRTLRPEGASSILLLAGLALLGFLSLGPVAASAVWGLALLLTLLNAGIFLEAREERRPGLALAGVALSWLLIGLWWATVPLDGRVVPALLLVALFSVLAQAGNAWTARGEEGAAPSRGVYLALLGHVFVLFVATQPNLALPPWPVFGALALLVLAAGVAALALRRGGLQAASLLLAHAAVLTWMLAAGRAPWPSVALAAGAALAAFGLAWIAAARRREGETGELTRTCAGGAAAGLLAAQVAAAVSGLGPASPEVALALPVQTGFAAALLALAWRMGWHGLAPASVATSFLAVAAFWRQDGPWWDHLALATVILLVYLAYPLALGRRARLLRQPWLAAVLASAAFFSLARLDLEALGFGDVIGALPLLQAGALALLLRKLLLLERSEPAAERDLGRLALVAGAVLAFVTVAIPLQLEKQWITIGWALLAAALAWLYGRIPHRGLLLWSAGLAAAVFARLALNPAVLTYHPRAAVPLWNWYLYTYLVAAAALLAAAWLLRRMQDRLAAGLPRLSTLLAGAGGVLLFLLLNIEIADFFATGPALTFGFLSSHATLAEGLTYTLGWGIFALALLVTGIAARSRGARIASIALLLATVLKGFLLDLAALGGLYRVASFVGLAACLAAVAVLIQRFVLARPAEAPAQEPAE